jgi:ATP-dependent Lon protease
MKIGLFPLGIVLFPNSYFNLHIFEERYRKLVKDCINEDLSFGINYVHDTKMYDVGCTAKIHKIIKEYDDGRYDILVKGEERYYLEKFYEGERTYYTGEVKTFDDGNEYTDPNLSIECIEQFNEIIKNIQIANIGIIPMANSSEKFLSFLIAQKAGFTPLQKQELLEMTSENKRLSFIKNHLKNLLPTLKKAEQIDRIIQNDGYITGDNLKI